MGAQVTVYVKSVKTIVGTKEFERRTPVSKLGDSPDRIELDGKRAGGTFVVKAYVTEKEPAYEFVLSEEQQLIVDLIEKTASGLRLEVKVIDVGRENVLRRAIQKEFEKIRLFPTLVSDSGMMLEGISTKEQIESFLRRVHKPDVDSFGLG
jgi:hypothetical protein